MKLFIWTNFCSDYTEGLAFAIAETEEQARRLVALEVYGETGGEPYSWGDLEVRDLNTPIAKQVMGAGG